MFVTDSGITISERDEQPSNKEESKLVIFEGIVIWVNILHPLNILVPISISGLFNKKPIISVLLF